MNEQKATPINQLGSLCAPGIGEVWCGVTGTVSPPSPAKKLSCRFNELPINRTDWDCVSVCVCVCMSVVFSVLIRPKKEFHSGKK